jgi:hypothetical protein
MTLINLIKEADVAEAADFPTATITDQMIETTAQDMGSFRSAVGQDYQRNPDDQRPCPCPNDKTPTPQWNGFTDTVFACKITLRPPKVLERDPKHRKAEGN